MRQIHNLFKPQIIRLLRLFSPTVDTVTESVQPKQNEIEYGTEEHPIEIILQFSLHITQGIPTLKFGKYHYTVLYNGCYRVSKQMYENSYHLKTRPSIFIGKREDSKKMYILFGCTANNDVFQLDLNDYKKRCTLDDILKGREPTLLNELAEHAIGKTKASALIQERKKIEIQASVKNKSLRQLSIQNKTENIIGYGAYAVIGIGLSTTAIAILLVFLEKQEAFDYGMQLKPEAAVPMLILGTMVMCIFIAIIADKCSNEPHTRNFVLLADLSHKSVLSAAIYRTATVMSIMGTAMMTTELTAELDPILLTYLAPIALSSSILLTVLGTFAEYKLNTAKPELR